MQVRRVIGLDRIGKGFIHVYYILDEKHVLASFLNYDEAKDSLLRLVSFHPEKTFYLTQTQHKILED